MATHLLPPKLKSPFKHSYFYSSQRNFLRMISDKQDNLGRKDKIRKKLIKYSSLSRTFLLQNIIETKEFDSSFHSLATQQRTSKQTLSISIILQKQSYLSEKLIHRRSRTSSLLHCAQYHFLATSFQKKTNKKPKQPL